MQDTRPGTLALLLSVAIAHLAAPTAIHPLQPAPGGDLARLTRSLRLVGEPGGGPAQRARYALSEDGYLRHLGTPPSHYIPVAGVVPGDAVGTAGSFIRERSALLGATSPAVDFPLFRVRERDRRRYVRFSQTYAGLPVYAARILVQLDELGGVRFVLSDIARELRALDDGEVSLRPSIPAPQAGAAAIELHARRGVTATLHTTAPRLAIFAPPVVGSEGRVRLVWDLTVASPDAAEVHERVLVDAHTGEPVRRTSLNSFVLDREIYDANDSSSIPGTPVREEGDPPSGLDDADWAYAYLDDTYSFYENVHGRVSFDDRRRGATLVAVVRYCRPTETCPWNNAMWGGSRFFFGSGWPSDDTVAHEYTHAVTDYESDLEYKNQSGAIEESFCDCWGEFVDRSNGAGTDTPEARWRAGEDIVALTEDGGSGDGIAESVCANLVDDDGDGRIDEGCEGSCQDGIDNGLDGVADASDLGCILRDLADPPRKLRSYYSNQFPPPDRMSSYYERDQLVVEDDCATCPGNRDGFCDAGENCVTWDHGGVHLNSGIGNKLCYLLSEGDSFNGQRIDGLGMSKIAGLYYEANTNLLSEASDYSDLGHALRQAAANLSWTVAERNDVYRGLVAVEISVGAGEDVFVDYRNLTGPEYGTATDPFNTVAEGLAAAATGDRLIVREGSYEENVTFRTIMTVEAQGGSAIIGDPRR